MKPNILICGANTSRKAYEDAVRKAGGEPHSFYLPPVCCDHDGLLLTGGGDLDPACYGQENTASENIDPQRDATELALTKLYLQAKKPIFGICRGHQVVNVALGGTLAQTLSQRLQLFHREDPETGDRVHPIRCIYGSTIHRLYGDVSQVNSAHHQVVSCPGTDMYVAAATECGLIEATQHLSLPVLTVQWHPERAENGQVLFDCFIEACRTGRF